VTRFQNIAVVVLAMLPALSGADTPNAAVSKVRDGIQKFRSSEFSEAEKSFAEASELAPENATILFDEACAALSAGDNNQARELFRKAALAKESPVTVQVHYNLGCLEAEAAREKLGDDAAAATGDVREESVRLMLAAVRHYRDTLALNAQHTDARHNLELIRLYIKHIQSQWAERDKQKDREEKNLLQFLKMIEERETQLRTTTRVLEDEQDSVRKRQAVKEAAASQRTLHEEIEPLRQKIEAELQSAAGPHSGSPTQQGSLPQPGVAAQTPGQNEQIQQAQDLLHQLADEAGQNMLMAADELDTGDSAAAIAAQTESLMLLHQLYMALAPYQNILQRAVERQHALLGTDAETEGPAELSEESSENQAATVRTEAPGNRDNGSNTVDDNQATQEGDVNVAGSDVDSATNVEQQQEGQSRITDWSRILSLKAEAELPQVQQQLEALRQSATHSPAEEPNPDKPKVDEPDAALEKENEQEVSEDEQAAAEAQRQQLQQLKQVEGLAKSMELAVQLAPDAERHSQAAVDLMLEQQEAVPEQQETHRILRKIAEPLVDQEQQQPDRNDQNQEDQQQDQPQDDDGDQNEQNQESQKDEQQENDQQQPGEEQQDDRSGQDKAESVLRQARDRERQHKDLQKQLRAILGQRIKVDRDW
jgi:hypothetical protein